MILAILNLKMQHVLAYPNTKSHPALPDSRRAVSGGKNIFVG